VIELKDISLWRFTQEEMSYDLKRNILLAIEGKRSFRKRAKRFVLENISLSVPPGQKVGIIGDNGAGKSTLLKVIAGIISPTSGTVSVKGKVAPLIELGAGFDSDLSLVDNIVMYGVFLGFKRRKILEEISSILEFAELVDYADMPLKHLSSGMESRLSFSIATSLKPDILVLDEVLSVGDVSFKLKSRVRMDELWADKTTVLFVSHDLEMVRELCSKCILLKEGKLVFYGESEAAINEYLKNSSGHLD